MDPIFYGQPSTELTEKTPHSQRQNEDATAIQERKGTQQKTYRVPLQLLLEAREKTGHPRFQQDIPDDRINFEGVNREQLFSTKSTPPLMTKTVQGSTATRISIPAMEIRRKTISKEVEGTSPTQKDTLYS